MHVPPPEVSMRSMLPHCIPAIANVPMLDIRTASRLVDVLIDCHARQRTAHIQQWPVRSWSFRQAPALQQRDLNAGRGCWRVLSRSVTDR
jgi:hypothetical protein